MVCVLCSDDDDEDTMQVDWEWGTVRYKMSSYNAAAAAAAAVRPAVTAASGGVQPAAGRQSVPVLHRTSPQHAAAAAATRPATDHVNNGVTTTQPNRPSKLISQPVSVLTNCTVSTVR